VVGMSPESLERVLAVLFKRPYLWYQLCFLPFSSLEFRKLDSNHRNPSDHWRVFVDLVKLWYGWLGWREDVCRRLRRHNRDDIDTSWSLLIFHVIWLWWW